MQGDAAQVKQRILVVGAGELGLAVLRGLAAHEGGTQADIAVLLRPATVSSQAPGKLAELDEIRALGVAVEPADVAAASVAELAAVFARYDTVIGCVGFAAGRGMQRKLTQAVLDAGVARYVPWQFGVDYDAIGRGSPQDGFDEQLDVRDMLRAQRRTEWIVISTGMFTSFLFEPAFGVVDLAGARVTALGSLDTAVTVTTPEDIGRLTAAIVLQRPRIANEVVYTAGDTLTYGELADLLERATGRRFERQVRSVPQLLADLAEAPDDNLRKYRAVFGLGRGVAWEVARTYNARNGIAVVGAEQWVRERLVAG
ncbi:aromatic alcohol reductase [Lysobacter enzymogenes]|uniref:aromatic alcohol reductase n=1 Tax=Lysobacter enzymogenes TaxID=69 RepID=UPI001A962687|nr:aromatic alcohol reductase [Lysobacter enzymogenes]QQP96722.1 aromatic alcohol reductase [Lysobacter enzymogenes]